MDLYEIVDNLDKCLSELQKVNTILENCNEEIKMWRNRYLKSSQPMSDLKECAHVWRYFLHAHAGTFTNPDQYFNECIKMYKER